MKLPDYAQIPWDYEDQINFLLAKIDHNIYIMSYMAVNFKAVIDKVVDPELHRDLRRRYMDIVMPYRLDSLFLLEQLKIFSNLPRLKNGRLINRRPRKHE